MGMHRERKIFGGASELQSEDRFGDHRSGIRSDDMDSQNLVRLRVGKYLGQPAHVPVAARSAVGREREDSRFVGNPSTLQFVLGLADSSHLR